MLKSIFEEVVVAQPLHWNMHRPIPPLPDTDRRSPQLYVPPRNRQHQRHLAERSRKTAPLRRKGLRSFDCDGSEKSANGLRARLLNVVLRPLSENRRPIPTEVPCGHFWRHLLVTKGGKSAPRRKRRIEGRDASRRIDRKIFLLSKFFFCAFGLIQKHQKIKHREK